MKIIKPENDNEKNLHVLHDVYGIKKLMQDNELLLVYHDEFSNENYDELLKLTELKMAVMDGDKKLKKRVFHIMVECVQNISRHAAITKDINSQASSIFVIGKDKSKFFIITGNLIENEKKQPLKERIERINDLDKDGLKELYKHTIENEDHNEAGGANLGLIDMARKAGGKIEYHFREIDATHSFFTFKVNIDPSN